MKYYIADCHFFHNNLNHQMDKRGFSSVEEMNEYMIAQWNKKVRRNDEVYILGDFSWGKPEETNDLLERLNGRLYMIRGNHDYYLSKNKFHAERFVWVKHYEEVRDHKRKVVLCHYPIMCYNGQYHLDKHGNPNVYMLYGHVHDTYDQRLIEQFQEITRQSKRTTMESEETRSIPSQMINCFCMYSNYIPLSLDEWIANDKKRQERRMSDENNRLFG